ncbi:MAG: zincin-like metallopeptidase domain-containing protein, partial [Burkholderiales bacterium]|nr:zincin-like metallopeptidase domain-containing protein [Burkholderiales bacterium]
MATDKNPRKELVDTIINSMKNRDGVWQKTWTNIASREAPYNPITGTKYRGVNFLVLSLEQTELDTIDPRWCTFKQAIAAGYQIAKGSKAAQASFYDLNVSLNDGSKDYYIKAKSVDGYVAKIIDHYRTHYPAKSIEIRNAVNKVAQFTTSSDKAQLLLFVTELNNATGADIKISSVAVMKSFPIFNYSQLLNVPELEIKPLNNFEPINRAEGILVASGAKIFHDNANENYYSPKRHEIHLTPKESFKSPEAYYSTALHEIGHWTKGDGLPRNLKVEGEINGDHLAYAREELRAELASVFMSSDLNLKLDIQNHSAYLGSYLEVLNNDYTEFFAAVSDAQKIASHVIGFEKRLDLESTEAKELQIKNPELYQKIVEYNNKTALLTAGEIDKQMQGFPVAVDSKYYIEAQKLFIHDYMMSGNEDPQLGFVFNSDDDAIEFIDKLHTELNIPKNAINDFDLTSSSESKELPTNIADLSARQTDYLINKPEGATTQIQLESRKPAHEAMKDFDTSASTQKSNPNKTYLET